MSTRDQIIDDLEDALGRVEWLREYLREISSMDLKGTTPLRAFQRARRLARQALDRDQERSK